MSMMPLRAFFRIRNVYGDGLIWNGCMQQLQDASYHVVVVFRSIRNRVHPLQATGMSKLVEFHWHQVQQLGGRHLSFSQTDFLNMYSEVKEKHQKNADNRSNHDRNWKSNCFSSIKQQITSIVMGSPEQKKKKKRNTKAKPTEQTDTKHTKENMPSSCYYLSLPTAN